MKMTPVVVLGLCASLLTSCFSPRTGKLKSMAVTYVKEKYGIKAKAEDVSVDAIGWLEPVWNNGKSGLVAMTYEGKTFYVRVDIGAGVEACTDTYLQQDCNERIESIVKEELACERLCVEASYGPDSYSQYVGIDIKSVDDVLEAGNIEVRVSAYGLDAGRVERFDTSRLGPNLRIGIYNFKDPKVVDARYVPMGSVDPTDGDLVCLLDHFYLLDGVWTHHPYTQFEGEGVTFGYRADLGVEIVPAKIDASDSGSAPATSAWYEVRSTTGEEQRVLVFPQVDKPDYKMRLQFYDPLTKEITTSSSDIAYYKTESAPPHILECPYHTFVWLNLTYKDGTVDRGPQIIRIQ